MLKKIYNYGKGNAMDGESIWPNNKELPAERPLEYSDNLRLSSDMPEKIFRIGQSESTI